MIRLMIEKDDLHLAIPILRLHSPSPDHLSRILGLFCSLLSCIKQRGSQLDQYQTAEFPCVRDQYCNHNGTESKAYQSSIDHRTNIQTRQSRRGLRTSSLGDRPDKGTSKQASFTEPCSAPLRGRYIPMLIYTRPLLFYHVDIRISLPASD